MNRLTKFSFSLLRICSIVLILLLFIVVLNVGAAGHSSSADSIMIIGVAGYLILLNIVLYKAQAEQKATFRILSLIMLLPIIGLSGYYVIIILEEISLGKQSSGALELSVLVTFTVLILSGLIVIKDLLFRKRTRTSLV